MHSRDFLNAQYHYDQYVNHLIGVFLSFFLSCLYMIILKESCLFKSPCLPRNVNGWHAHYNCGEILFLRFVLQLLHCAKAKTLNMFFFCLFLQVSGGGGAVLNPEASVFHLPPTPGLMPTSQHTHTINGYHTHGEYALLFCFVLFLSCSVHAGLLDGVGWCLTLFWTVYNQMVLRYGFWSWLLSLEW